MNTIKTLLQPGEIGSLKLKNRLIYSSMGLRSTDGMGHLTEAAIESMVFRAKQSYSPAMITFPSCSAYHISGTSCGLDIHLSDREAMRHLAKAVKRVKINDVKVMANIYGRGTRLQNGTHDNVGPSDMRFGYEEYPARALTVPEIKERIQDFVDATVRAREAGFDAIELHACTGKLISLFLSPYSNHRTDEYGGSVEGRAQFLVEILKFMRQKIGNDYPLVVMLGVDDLLGKYGLTLEQGKQIAQLIEPYIDAIKPSCGTQEKIWNISVGYAYPQGYMLDKTEAIKQIISKPVIAMGKLGNPALAENVVKENKADFVALGRSLLVDPQWITKAATGKGQIRSCIGCLNCFSFNDRKEIVPTRVSCTMNPGLLREDSYDEYPLAEKSKRILVVGGGLAGIEAAITLAQRGHHVTLAEKNSTLGGQWLVASYADHKKDYKTLLPYKENELANSTVEVRLDCLVDNAFLSDFCPDEVVLATGALPKSLPFALSDDSVPVVYGNDVIMQKVTIGERVVIIGGRYIGLEVAAMLSAQGKDVSVVDMTELGKGANPRLIGIYRDQMVANGVRMYPNAPVLGITDQGVNIVQMNSLLTLPADTVVLTMGTTPLDHLQEDLEALHIPYYKIGDCKRIGDALYAIRDGAEIGRLL